MTASRLNTDDHGQRSTRDDRSDSRAPSRASREGPRARVGLGDDHAPNDHTSNGHIIAAGDGAKGEAARSQSTPTAGGGPRDTPHKEGPLRKPRHQKHAARIAREYLSERGIYVWRVDCNCGFKGENRFTARQAERDLDAHIGVKG